MSSNTLVNNSYNKGQLRKPKVPIIYSWLIIFIFFTFFTPVSWVFMYQRSKIDRESNGVLSIVFGFFGIMFLLMALLYFFLPGKIEGQEPQNNIFISIVALVFGGIHLFVYHNCRKAKLRFMRFVDLVFIREIRRIDEIAQAMSISSEAVIAYFNELIMYGYITNGVVKEGYLVIDGEGNYYSSTKTRTNTPTSIHLSDHHKKTQKEPRSGTILCKNCGANVVLKGFGPVTCEYCDTAN